jgi:hypothetical protein
LAVGQRGFRPFAENRVVSGVSSQGLLLMPLRE